MSDNNLSDKIGKLKCPFCQKELRPLARGWCCDCGLCADKELWQRLICTRKALVVAVNAIETIKYSKKSDAINLRHKANKALIEIYKIKDLTELEQKE